jgi:hypothetical protein
MCPIRRQLIYLCLWLPLGNAWAQSMDMLDIRGIVDIHAFTNNSSLSWYSRGFGKLRYDDGSFPLQLGSAALHVDLHLSDTLWLRSLTTAYTDPKFDPNLIEAYFNYRPVPRGPTRMRVKAGVFHLPISTENKGIGWSSLYSTTPSMINSWVGEELRVVGTELEFNWPGRFRRSAHDYTLLAGLYGFNDGAGTLLAYRGWAQHDRQTGFEDTLVLVPDLEAGIPIRQFHPFWEIDKRVGYYIGGAWSYINHLEIKYMHYDNRADPTARKGFELAWETRFEHVSAEIELPAETRLLAQFISGDTYILNLNNNNVSLTDYQSWFVLLSRRIGQHRISARYEYYEAKDLDGRKNTVHNADEDGWSWMLAWRYQFSKEIQVGLEWLQIRSNKAARLLVLGDASETENQLLLNMNYRF